MTKERIYRKQLSEDEKNTFLLDLFENKPDLNLKLKRKLRKFMPLQEKEKQAARIKELQLLAKKEPLVWQQIDSAIQLKTSKGYDAAAKLLRDLKHLSIYLGETEQFI